VGTIRHKLSIALFSRVPGAFSLARASSDSRPHSARSSLNAQDRRSPCPLATRIPSRCSARIRLTAVMRFFLPWPRTLVFLDAFPHRAGYALRREGHRCRETRPRRLFRSYLPRTKAPSIARQLQDSGRTHFGDSFEISILRFPIVLSEFDLYPGEGRHYDTYEKLGAHVITLEGVRGVSLRRLGSSARRVSVWETSIAGWPRPSHARTWLLRLWNFLSRRLNEGAIYKYRLWSSGNILPT